MWYIRRVVQFEIHKTTVFSRRFILQRRDCLFFYFVVCVSARSFRNGTRNDRIIRISIRTGQSIFQGVSVRIPLL